MENKYSFIAKIALEYRLSLGNICKLFNMEPNDENKIKVYNLIMSTIINHDLRLAYDFLFNYETINEDEKSSALAFSKTLIFLKRYSKAQKSGDKEQLKLIMKELSKTDIDFEVVKKKDSHIKMEEKDILAISKFRLKYCISKTRMAESLDIGREIIHRGEEKINDNRLKQKLNLLSHFYDDLYAKKKKSRTW